MWGGEETKEVKYKKTFFFKKKNYNLSVTIVFGEEREKREGR